MFCCRYRLQCESIHVYTSLYKVKIYNLKFLTFNTRPSERFYLKVLPELYKKFFWGGSFLVVQWLRICLATQGTPVQSLVWEDHVCRGAVTKPVCHNY